MSVLGEAYVCKDLTKLICEGANASVSDVIVFDAVENYLNSVVGCSKGKDSNQVV